ncbi:MAG: hypothetical protein MJA83_02305, partial [Gammaproteobacteria bacterium]|nr:hypothetical protein [Gammaproteobacteria bacterium]
NFRFFINDGDNLFEPGADDGAAITSIDDLVSSAGTNSVEIWVEDDIPLTAVDGDLIVITLTAEVATTAGVAINTDDSGAANVEDGAAENIFSTALFATSGDLTADDAYDIDSAALAISKTLVVISDPVNGTTNPHAIPGAVMEYRIQVANTGSQAADSVVITDDLTTEIVTNGNLDVPTLAANGAYADGSSIQFDLDIGGGYSGTNATNAEDADICEYDGTTPATPEDVICALGSVAAGVTAEIRFRVTVQ